jgi:asparagine synthase (glutamine-hydrolysing)
MEQAVYRSDGYIGLSGAAELYANEIARRIAPIRMTGNCGSELLRGVRAFKSELPAAGFFSPDLSPQLEEAQGTFAERGQQHPVSFALFELAPYQGFGRRSLEKSQVIMRSPFMDNDLVKLVYQKPRSAATGREEYLAVFDRFKPVLRAIPTDHGELGQGGLLVTKLRQAYRLALAKAEYWADHGMPQWAATISAHAPGLLPVTKLIGRNKFQHFRLWLQHELSAWVKDTLLPHVHSSAYLDGKQLGHMLDMHLNGSRNFTREIDLALTIVMCEGLLLR